MPLSSDLISQFVKLANSTQTTKNETTAYGTVKIQNGMVFVKIDGSLGPDGSELLTPVCKTTELEHTAVDVEDNERVIVSIKDHTVTITGNTSSPAARTDTVKEQNKKIDEFDIIVAHKVTTDELATVKATIETLKAITATYEDMTAVTAEIETLHAKFAELKYLTADEVTALNGEFESLKSIFGSFSDLAAEDLEVANAEIDKLIAYTATFTYVETELLKAYNADIGTLDANKLNVNWANIDFAEIDMATIGQLFSTSGIIKDLTTESGTVTGELVGVTIKGDWIEGNTIQADKLVVLGEDGIYYKLNIDGLDNISVSQASKFDVTTSEPENWSTNYKDYYVVNNNSYVHITGDSAPTWTANTYYKLNSAHESGLDGTAIIAKSITAEKISVSDLVAFGAKIGGFFIGQDRIYSGVKETVENSTTGIYLDTSGQFAVGDQSNYLRFYKVPALDETGNEILDDDGNPVYELDADGKTLYKLEISADSILFGSGTKSSAQDIKNLTDHIKLDPDWVDPDTGESLPCVELSEGDTDFKMRLTNKKVVFVDGTLDPTVIDSDGMTTENFNLSKDFNHSGFVWNKRANGNYGLSYKGVFD